MIAVVTGGRYHQVTPAQEHRFLWALRAYDIGEVWHGACPTGVDAWLDGLAAEIGLKVERFPAYWGVQSRSAGSVRNKYMLQGTRMLLRGPNAPGGVLVPEYVGKPDVCIAYPGGTMTDGAVKEAIDRLGADSVIYIPKPEDDHHG